MSRGSTQIAGLVTREELQAAQSRIRGVAVRTPLLRMDVPGDVRVGRPYRPPGVGSGAAAGELWIKAESLQPIGSFKLRGAFNKIAQLTVAERSRGVITYSSGNHGQGVAYAARQLGIEAVVVMPSGAPAIKRRAVAALGAKIVEVGPGSYERKAKAEEMAAAAGYSLIPPYDDRGIIAGQGSCGLEIVEEMPDVGLVLVPVGGGGLLSGVAAAVKLTRPEAKVIGVEPELAGDAAQSFKTGHVVSLSGEQTARTLADGLRSQSVGLLNFAHMEAYVDDIVTVTETEIREAMRKILFAARLVPEPSGAVAVAAALFHPEVWPGSAKTVAVMSGGNVEPEVLASVLGKL